jgi:hypothetical protein
MNSSNNVLKAVDMFLKNSVLNGRFQHFYISIGNEVGL